MERIAVRRANPYAPPEDSVRARASSGAASVLVVVLMLVVAIRAFRSTLYLAVLFDWGSVREAMLLFVPQPLDVTWTLTWPLLVAAVVSFCVWVYRANGDVRNLGAEGMFFSPAWSVGIGFIPVANLIGPYRAVKEIHQASDPSTSGQDWMHVPVPASLPLWWGFWLASIVWNMVSRSLSAESLPWGLALAETARGIAALLLIAVVRGIERRLADKARMEL